jgi:hypothetical protein
VCVAPDSCPARNGNNILRGKGYVVHRMDCDLEEFKKRGFEVTEKEVIEAS